MNEQRYRKTMEFFRSHNALCTILKLAYTILPFAVFICYPLLMCALLELMLRGKADPMIFVKSVVVPAVTFISLSILRRIINMPRPYEVYDVEPIILRDKKGESFPSRHTVSVFIIAMVALYLFPPAGCVCLVIAVILSVTRVLAGVHFIRDVVAGVLYAILLGSFGLFLI